ncbi:MAG: metal-dependent hydrolase, partial [Betaproteobacteria bacterium]|nr:metal-dependent hydrolase [Betaproteobacteria bacterium]
MQLASERVLQWRGTLVLLRKEIIRFRKVSVQTVLAPVVSAVLFLIVFQHVLAGRIELPGGISYAAFLVPGLAMMALQQNAFANSSSSLTQSKV